ncbi:MAG: hypothetical protein ACFE8J_19065 [Candidatus Heimdallarchaeota archaeon]
MANNKIHIDIKKLIVIIILVVFIVVNYFVWIIFGYPAKAGYMGYEAHLPEDFNISQAKQLLEHEDYICDLESYHASHLRIATSISDYRTHLNLIIDEENGTIQINAYSYIKGNLLYYTVTDLKEIERKWQISSEIVVHDVIVILDLPRNGTYWYREEIDSSDYSKPFNIFYLTIFIDLIVIIGLIFFIIIFRKKKQIPRPTIEHPPHQSERNG